MPAAAFSSRRKDSRKVTHEAWLAEAQERFGQDPMKWAFICPSCGHIATIADWKAHGASEGEVAFSCVGRRMGAGGDKTFKRQGGPCNYAGGGLFRINPIHVEMPDGVIRETFEFAPENAPG